MKRQYFTLALTLVLISTTIGFLSAWFLHSLDFVTTLRAQWPWLMLFLPLGGFLWGWVEERFGAGQDGGTNLLLDEIQEPQRHLSRRFGALVWAGSLLSHLVGASVGREGAAVQLGGCTADQVQKRMKMPPQLRPAFLLTGIAAGFSSAFSVPLAGFVFSLEVLRLPWRVRLQVTPFCLLSAFLANYVTVAFEPPHVHYPVAPEHTPASHWLWGICLIGISGGIIAFLFIQATHHLQDYLAKRIRYRPYRLMLGGAVAGFALHILGNRYAGLGIDVIVESFQNAMGLSDPVVKGLLTALSVGSGFRGGEVTPLLYIGSTFGSWFSQFTSVPVFVGAAAGLVCVLAGALNAPLTCAVMVGEILGWQMGLWVIPACLLSYIFSGPHSVYHAQVGRREKFWHIGRLKKDYSKNSHRVSSM